MLVASSMTAIEVHSPTPRLTDHARRRCEEMEIRTRRVKRVVRDPDLCYGSADGYHVVCRFDEPTFRVVIDRSTRPETVVTVIWWTNERYERPA